MNSEKIFEIALGLQSPWYISGLNFEEVSGNHILHLEIDYEKGYYVNSDSSSNVHDRKLRKWRYLNFFQHECYTKL